MRVEFVGPAEGIVIFFLPTSFGRSDFWGH